MDRYLLASQKTSKALTLTYSSSFGLASRLFDSRVKRHIYAIYGLTRIADEIVDTYRSTNAETLLVDLERQTYDAIKIGYSTNPIVHAFQDTAQTYRFPKEILEAFFNSMKMDLRQFKFTQETYDEYIHGSAEVIGLMCLRVFCDGDDEIYENLRDAAAALGSAYQKINFLRDMCADYHELGRYYFPIGSYKNLPKRPGKLLLLISAMTWPLPCLQFTAYQKVVEKQFELVRNIIADCLRNWPLLYPET